MTIAIAKKIVDGKKHNYYKSIELVTEHISTQSRGINLITFGQSLYSYTNYNNTYREYWDLFEF